MSEPQCNSHRLIDNCLNWPGHPHILFQFICCVMHTVVLQFLLPAPGDFVDPVEIVLQFDSISNSRTVTITIVDDNVLEDDETFFGNLVSTDPQVIAAPRTAVVTIVEDNDGE